MVQIENMGKVKGGNC